MGRLTIADNRGGIAKLKIKRSFGFNRPDIFYPATGTVKISFQRNWNHRHACPARQFDTQRIKIFWIEHRAAGGLWKNNHRTPLANAIVAFIQHQFQIFTWIFAVYGNQIQRFHDPADNRIISQFIFNNKCDIVKCQSEGWKNDRFKNAHMICNIDHRAFKPGDAFKARYIQAPPG